MSLSLNINRDDLLTGLGSLQNVTGKKGTIAILSNVLLQTDGNSLLLTGTDLEVGIKNRLEAEVLSQGTITLPARKLFEIIRETEATTVRLEEQNNNQVKIEAGKSQYRLAGSPSEEFPSFPEYSEDTMVSLPSDLLKDLIDKTIFSLAPEGDSQLSLTGILFEREKRENGAMLLRMVSSDGHRLTLMEKEADSGVENLKMDRIIIIPRKGVQEISKLCERADSIRIGFEEKQAVVQAENSIIIIRLMQGDFPDYRNIISIIEHKNPLEVERQEFIKAMRRMNLFAEDKYNAVHFNIQGNKMVLSSQSMDLGDAKSEMEISYGGQDLILGFNGKYCLETMQVLHSEKLKAYINSVESPCLIVGDEDEGFKSIIMPMKI